MTERAPVPAELLARAKELLDSGPRGNAQNTKASLIAPLLDWLGWDTRNFNEVDHEYRYRSAGNPVDYALKIDRTPRLLVEAKGVREDLNDAKWAEQALAYASAAGVQWVVLTNGVCWQVYNAHAAVPATGKMLRTCSLFDADAADVLALIAKDQVRGDRLSAVWEAEHVDRRVADALHGLFSGTDVPSPLVRLINDAQPDLSRAQVRASLQRCRAQFDFPSLPADTPPENPVSHGNPAAFGNAGAASAPAGWVDSGGTLRPSTAPVSVRNAATAARIHDAFCNAGLTAANKKLYVNYAHGGQPVASLIVKGTLLWVHFTRLDEQVLAAGGERITAGHWGVGTARIKVLPDADLTEVCGLICALAASR